MKRPDEDVLEANLQALFSRAYVAVQPSSAFRAGLLAALRESAPVPAPALAHRAARPPRLARLALAAGLLVALGLGLWAALAARGGEHVPGRDVSQLARAHDPLRPFTADESARGVEFESGRLEVAVASARNVELVHVGAYGSLRLESGARASLEGDAQHPRVALHAGRATLERLDTGAPWRIEAAGSRLELESGTLQLVRPAAEPDVLLARVDSGSTRLAPAGEILPLHRELRLLVGALEPGSAALERGERGQDRRTLAAPEPENGAPGAVTSPPAAALVLAGRVLRPDGAPCAKFRLVALREERLPAVAMPIEREFESADGTFRFPLPRDGRYALFVLAPDCAVRKLEGLVPSATPGGLEVRLEDGVELRGRVIDAASGQAIAAATVLSEDDAPLQVLPFDTADLPLTLSARATTDAEGRFVLAHLSARRHTLRASAAGYCAAWSRRLDARGENAPVELALTPGGGLSIALEPPAAGARLIASAVDKTFQRPCLSYSGGLSDARGELHLEHLAPGTYVVLRMPVLGTSDVRYAIVEEGATTELVLGPQAASHVLAGRALDADGAPLADLDLMLQASDHSEQHWSSLRSDAQGRFRFEDVASGEYCLYVGDLGRNFVELGRVRVGTLDVARDFQLGRCTIRGRMQEAPGAAPVEGWLIAQQELAGEWEFRGKAQSLPGGAFAFEGLQPGRWRVIALSLNRRLAPAIGSPLELGPAAPAGEVELTLEPGAALEIVVRDEAGAARAGVKVELCDERGARWQFSASDCTDSSGRFRVPGLAPGRWRLALARAGAARVERTIELAVDQDATVELVLP